MNSKKAIEVYQCPGCVNASEDTCFAQGTDSVSCVSHVPGTVDPVAGIIFAGMPKGFNQTGEQRSLKLHIFNRFEPMFGSRRVHTLAVWKYLDANGNTLIRGLRPEQNETLLHVYLENCMDKFNCTEVYDADFVA